MASNPTLKSVMGTYMPLHAHKRSSTHAKEHMLNHHWSFPGNKKKPLWIKSLELNIREVQSSALIQKKKIIIFQRERGEESEVEGGRL